MSRNREAIVATALTWAVALAGLTSLVACSKKLEKPVETKVTQAQEVPQDAQIAAMLRGHPNSKRICVDSSRDRAFFLDYGPLPKPNEPSDGLMHGWYFVEKIEFYSAPNGTWFITGQEDSKYITVYPDVNGLVCQQQGQ